MAQHFQPRNNASQYQDRQMHTCPDLLWPWSQVTQLRDLLLQEAFPVPFAFLLDAQVKDKDTLDLTLPPHTLAAPVAAGLEFVHLPDKLLDSEDRAISDRSTASDPNRFSVFDE